ncbi:MAG: IS66 family transposase [Luteolibacter sp.]
MFSQEFAGTSATPGLIAHVLVAKYCDHLPFYRQEKILATRHGASIDRNTLCGWSLLASDWLSAIYREIESEHRLAGYLQLDETPIHYLVPGSGKAQTGYLWTSHLPGGSVLYRWRKGRDQGGIGELLGHTAHRSAPLQILQCDGYSAYPAWARDHPHVTLAGCHAHVRRKFYEARDQHPKLVGWILRQFGHLYQIERRLRETRASPVLRKAYRAFQSAPIHRRLKRLFGQLALRRTILPKSLLGRALTYALNQWRHLEPWLTDGRIEIDNNLVENAIRPTKLGAKNWLFIGREAAGQKSAILYTIVENCRRLGIDPRNYLTDVLTRLPGMKNHEVSQLVPANWLKTQAIQTSRRAA